MLVLITLYQIIEQLCRTVVPLYASYSLVRMTFTTILIKRVSAMEIVQTVIEGETLADDLLLLLTLAAVVFTLLLLSVSPEEWVLAKARLPKGAGRCHAYAPLR